jgi:phosphoribosylformylglycinamidine (FGAM) synthase PurS component
MTQPKAYRLNVDTIQSLEDVKVILKGLNLLTYSNVNDFDILQKYFTDEIETEQQEEEIVEEDCDTCS